MKIRRSRTRKVVVYSIIGGLSVLMMIGILLLIFDDTSVQATVYEIIAFLVGMIGMIMAVLAELDASKRERESERIIREINKIARGEAEDTELLKQVIKKLDGQNWSVKK